MPKPRRIVNPPKSRKPKVYGGSTRAPRSIRLQKQIKVSCASR